MDQIRAIGKTVHIPKRAPRLSRPHSVLQTVRWIASIARQENAQLVHSTLAYGAIFGAPAALAARIPHLWFQHGPVTGWQDWLAGHLPAKLIFTSSRYTQEQQARLSTTSRHLHTLRLGVFADPSATALHVTDARAGLLEKFLRLRHDVNFLSGMICRVQSQKGVEVWIEALRLLRAEGIKAGGVLIGVSPTESSYEKELRARAQEQGVPLLWLEQTPTPWIWAKGCHALVCSSIFPEGYGLTLAEAQTYGVPTIAPREGGPLDLISENETGLLFEPRNPGDLAKKLARLARDPGLAPKLVERAQQFAEKELPASRSVERLEESYRKCLEVG